MAELPRIIQLFDYSNSWDRIIIFGIRYSLIFMNEYYSVLANSWDRIVRIFFSKKTACNVTFCDRKWLKILIILNADTLLTITFIIGAKFTHSFLKLEYAGPFQCSNNS